MSKRKIICFTGTRADYGIYRSLLIELEKDQTIELQLVVTGMHVLQEYGSTIEEIKKDSFEILEAPSILVKGDSTYAMSQSVSLALMYFSNILHHAKPDGILILGDRGEMLAAALAAHYQNITSFHLHGGEMSGSADDAVRHAISRLSTFHFVSTNQSKYNLIQMGIDQSRIVVTGSLRKHDVAYVKRIESEVRKRLIEKKVILSPNKKILFVMHPDSKEDISFQKQIETVLLPLSSLEDVDVIILGTNSDAGGEVFRNSINKYRELNKNAVYIESLPPYEFLYLLSEVNLFIGNSSSGIIEAPFYHLPFLNIGRRQQNREQGGNVINAPYDSKIIEENIHKLLSIPKIDYENPYDVLDSPAVEIVKYIKSWIKS